MDAYAVNKNKKLNKFNSAIEQFFRVYLNDLAKQFFLHKKF